MIVLSNFTGPFSIIGFSSRLDCLINPFEFVKSPFCASTSLLKPFGGPLRFCGLIFGSLILPGNSIFGLWIDFCSGFVPPTILGSWTICCDFWCTGDASVKFDFCNCGDCFRRSKLLTFLSHPTSLVPAFAILLPVFASSIGDGLYDNFSGPFVRAILLCAFACSFLALFGLACFAGFACSLDFSALVFGDSTWVLDWSQSEVELSECSERAEEKPDELDVRLDTAEDAFPRSWFLSLLLKSLNLSRTEFLFCCCCCCCWAGWVGWPE